MKRVVFILLIILSFASCAPSRYVRPLAKKQSAISANFGGPMIGFSGAVIPIPLTAIGYGYGVDSLTTVFGNLHTTSFLYGVVQTDIGVTRGLYHNANGFGISAGFTANLMFDKWEHHFRGFPQIDANAYKSFGKHNSYWYAGFDTWFDLTKTQADGQPQKVHVMFDPHAGVNFRQRNKGDYKIEKGRWNYQLELKMIAPYLNNQPNAVDYKGFDHQGAVGFYFGVYRTF